MKSALFSLIVLLSACVDGSYAVRCYVCTGAITPFKVNEWCNDKFDNTTAGAVASVQTCTGPCVKLYSKVGDSIEGYIRQCSNISKPDCQNDCQSYSDITGCEHCCNTDLCNDAGHMTFNLLAAAAMLVFAWTFTSQ